MINKQLIDPESIVVVGGKEQVQALRKAIPLENRRISIKCKRK